MNEESPVLAYMRTLNHSTSTTIQNPTTPITWDYLLMPMASLSRRLGRYHYYCWQDLVQVPLARFAVDPALCCIFKQRLFKTDYDAVGSAFSDAISVISSIDVSAYSHRGKTITASTR